MEVPSFGNATSLPCHASHCFILCSALQLGGLALHEGRVAEMKTGEGKTLVATLPAYLHALEGEGPCHCGEGAGANATPGWQWLGLQCGKQMLYQLRWGLQATACMLSL